MLEDLRALGYWEWYSYFRNFWRSSCCDYYTYVNSDIADGYVYIKCGFCLRKLYHLPLEQ